MAPAGAGNVQAPRPCAQACCPPLPAWLTRPSSAVASACAAPGNEWNAPQPGRESGGGVGAGPTVPSDLTQTEVRQLGEPCGAPSARKSNDSGTPPATPHPSPSASTQGSHSPTHQGCRGPGAGRRLCCPCQGLAHPKCSINTTVCHGGKPDSARAPRAPPAQAFQGGRRGWGDTLQVAAAFSFLDKQGLR